MNGDEQVENTVLLSIAHSNVAPVGSLDASRGSDVVYDNWGRELVGEIDISGRAYDAAGS